jgi:hypothetical protein
MSTTPLPHELLKLLPVISWGVVLLAYAWRKQSPSIPGSRNLFSRENLWLFFFLGAIPSAAAVTYWRLGQDPSISNWLLDLTADGLGIVWGFLALAFLIKRSHRIFPSRMRRALGMSSAIRHGFTPIFISSGSEAPRLPSPLPSGREPNADGRLN